MMLCRRVLSFLFFSLVGAKYFSNSLFLTEFISNNGPPHRFHLEKPPELTNVQKNRTEIKETKRKEMGTISQLPGRGKLHMFYPQTTPKLLHVQNK
jgi:hypothetical protein